MCPAYSIWRSHIVISTSLNDLLDELSARALGEYHTVHMWHVWFSTAIQVQSDPDLDRLIFRKQFWYLLLVLQHTHALCTNGESHTHKRNLTHVGHGLISVKERMIDYYFEGVGHVSICDSPPITAISRYLSVDDSIEIAWHGSLFWVKSLSSP